MGIVYLPCTAWDSEIDRLTSFDASLIAGNESIYIDLAGKALQILFMKFDQ